LKDVPAKHTDIVFMGAIGSMVPGCPVGDKLVDTQAPANSWLLKKVNNQQGTCGTQMPQPPTTLRPDELACVAQYVYCVAGQMPPL
jgi:hypothetical protein